MQREQRKAAVEAYKERKTIAGIYALHCRASGQRWVGRAADMDSIENRLSFMLRQGQSPYRTLQAAMREHGAAAFDYEEIERLADEPLAYARERLLKERLVHWCAALSAEAI